MSRKKIDVPTMLAIPVLPPLPPLPFEAKAQILVPVHAPASLLPQAPGADDVAVHAPEVVPELPALTALPVMPTLPVSTSLHEVPQPIQSDDAPVSQTTSPLVVDPVQEPVPVTHKAQQKLETIPESMEDEKWHPSKPLVDLCTKIAHDTATDIVNQVFDSKVKQARAQLTMGTGTSVGGERKQCKAMESFVNLPVPESYNISSTDSVASAIAKLDQRGFMHTVRIMQILANPAQNVISCLGIGLAPQLLAPSSCAPVNSDSAEAPFLSFLNKNREIPACAGIASPVFNMVRVGWCPEFSCLVRIPTVSTSAPIGKARYWIGLSDCDLRNLDSSKLKAHRLIAFYADALDQQWYAVSSNGTLPGIQRTKTRFTLSNDPVLEFHIRVRSTTSGALGVDFHINRQLVASHGSESVPEKACALGYLLEAARIETTGLTQLDFSRMMISF